MGVCADFYRAAVGKKALMAATGILLYLYIVAHMLGNLKIFQGPEIFNHYAEWLRAMGSPPLPYAGALWFIRAVMILAIGAHIVAAVQLTLLNRQARPDRYVRHVMVSTNYAARTMIWGGIIIALFIIYHLLDLTWGTVNPDFVPGDVYHNVVADFRNWGVSGVYIAAQVALGFHLYHGVWSLFQSLGWEHPLVNPLRKGLAIASAIVITLGFIIVPLAVLAGIVGETP